MADSIFDVFAYAKIVRDWNIRVDVPFFVRENTMVNRTEK